jgi:hypothetical protein
MKHVKLATAAALVLCAAFALSVGSSVRAAPPAITPPRDYAKELADLEKQIKDTEIAFAHSLEGVQAAEKRMKIIKDALRCGCGSMADLLDAQEVVMLWQEKADEAAAKLTKLRNQLAKLKVARSKA